MKDFLSLMTTPRMLSDNFFNDAGFRFPAVQMDSDIVEEDGCYKVIADVPGFAKEDIHIKVNDGVLEISAETDTDNSKDVKNYIHRERFHSSMRRRYSFRDIDEAGVKATFKDGVLEVVLPKQEPKITSHDITIE